ncbi:TetR/AcrR family transcriptional regulator [Actinokineospora bangkokensis]|uniref:TetR family transcriptional regulator n=1 Tax=Actinokineospora bangkokensis TaxID=1193682 RepID=A0A1Q9LL49_9PSEU|nr:TetR/AcrR family transcriptional regulator [Actinokineospora bangkokensis]OLR92709.1 TetR family transcriptional regulator [Actinokineospora bangkokensis]
MADRTRRAPTGAAVLQPQVTTAIADAVLTELADAGYGRLSMEAVAKRAGVGKSALYRRWPSKREMVVSVVSELSVPMARVPDTGSLRGDLRAVLAGVHEWITHPLLSRILPDLTAEATRTPALAGVIADMIGEPRRARGAEVLTRAVARGELPADVDVELAMDLVAAPLYWRVRVRQAELEDDYLDKLVDLLVRALTR